MQSTNINILINGKETSRDSSMLFRDLLKSLSSEIANRSEVISEIRIDGKPVDEDQENAFSMSSIGRMGTIELKTSDTMQLALQALATAKDYIKQIIPLSKRTGKYYVENNFNMAEKSFIVLVDNLERLTELLTSIQFVLKGKVRVSLEHDSSLRIAQVRLVSAIQELLPAKLENKTDLLADTLINELPDALREMRDIGIPVLQRQK